MPTRPPLHRPSFTVNPPPPRERHGWQGSSRRAGLYDYTWQKLRAAFLAANPLCLFCQRAGRATPAHHVDHIETIADRPELRLVWSNLRGLCESHHNQRTAQDQAAARKDASR